MKISLYRALLLLLVGVFALALVPAGVGLDRRIAAELEGKAKMELAMGPELLLDRVETRAEALRMHAKDLASMPGLAEMLTAGDSTEILTRAREAADALGEEVILADADGRLQVGPPVPDSISQAARTGEMPIWFPARERVLQSSVAAVLQGDIWVGTAGVSVAFDDQAAARLAALTRSDVAILDEDDRIVASSSGDEVLPVPPSDSLQAWSGDGGVHEHAPDPGARRWHAVAPIGDRATAVFSRSVTEATAVMPALRRGALLAAGVAFGLALVLASLAASLIARPVRSLVAAARELEKGDSETPVPSSAISEVDRLSSAFRSMRSSLAARMEELRNTNEELTEREARLKALQSEIIQQDRLEAAGRVVAELAHEIRNPVANVRNCLEVIRRRDDIEPETREFVDLAIDELLRMHGLAEQLLDLNRPVDPGADTCDPRAIVDQVVELMTASKTTPAITVDVEGSSPLAAIGPDPLKQVLLNVVQNAREAMPDGGGISVRLQSTDSVAQLDVTDEGAGIPPDVLPRVFDPFFTTKRSVRGVGLGLFVAEGIVGRHGGRIAAANRSDRTGARFRIEIPLASEDGK